MRHEHVVVHPKTGRVGGKAGRSVHDVRGQAEEGGGEQDRADGRLGPSHGAQGRTAQLPADDHVTEYGQYDSQPHGDRVARDDEIRVEYQVEYPASATQTDN